MKLLPSSLLDRDSSHKEPGLANTRPIGLALSTSIVWSLARATILSRTMFAKGLTVFIATATAALADFRVLETQTAAPHGFSRVGPAPPEKTVRLRLALAQGNEDGLIEALYSVSDPSSSRYGQHLTREEVSAFVHPRCVSHDDVLA